MMTQEEYAREVGKRLEWHRRQQRISRERLAEMTGLDQGTIFNVEVGRGALYLTVAVMRSALKMTPEQLEGDLVMRQVQDIHPGGSAENQKAESLRASKPATRGVC